MAEAHEIARGRAAERPWHIPKRGWWETLLRVKDQTTTDHVGLIAAGCAFYGLLALFPAIAAAIAIWGLVADPGEIVRQIDGFTRALPPEAAQIIHEQAANAASSDSGALITAILAILVGVYSASKGIKSLTEGLNIAYDEGEGRGFLKQTILNLALTFGAVIGVIAAVLLIVVVPVTLSFVGLGVVVETLGQVFRWVILVGGALLAFGTLYWIGPHRERATWHWVTPGAVLGVLLWVGGSGVFSIYVAKMASYDSTYGALGSVVVLLMWLWLTAFAILLGAELNCELERQTTHDTTSGPPRPMGDRGAYAADTVAEPRLTKAEKAERKAQAKASKKARAADRSEARAARRETR